MPSPWRRATTLAYLAALVLTSLPVSAGLLGWCPCGCLPETLVNTPVPGDSAPGEGDHHDSDHCRGTQHLPYGPLPADELVAERVDAGTLAAEADELLPPTHHAPLIRPPRA
jgi:hypothetical protein